MKKNILLGLLLSALLVYLSIRGIPFREVWQGINEINPVYLAPMLALLLLMQILRSIRWGIILKPLATIDQLSLFSVTSVGFLAIAAIPARIGELARPYLITKKSPVRMSSALGTIFVERIFDGLTVMLIFVGLFFMTPLPPWLIRWSVVFIALTLIILLLMVTLLVKREKSLEILDRLLKHIPKRYGQIIQNLWRHFIDGFQSITRPAHLLGIAVLSLLIWIVDVLAIYLLFLAFDFDLSLMAAFVVMVILLIGIILPAGPGFVGNWHFFCILGLGLFGISRTDALSFAVMYHFLALGIILVLGLIFLPFNRFSLKDLKRQRTDGPP